MLPARRTVQGSSLRAAFGLGQGRRVGGENLDTPVHTPVRDDQGVGPQRQTHLTHGLTIRYAKEPTDFHAALLPPKTVFTPRNFRT